ncbi:MAG TPA: hypothetical protein VFZ09_35790 [Archangium sp.]|uniref:hypothetical protein n=1 Tax=Archangium sp. TaxID=1872627 RepID=UPI002E345B6E|nr:hypothetical protein [Archangium sp.]HEX5751639.1 hypothetical protein [Archangium sp.]
MAATHGGKHVSWKSIHRVLGALCLWAAPALAQNKPVAVSAAPAAPVAPAPAPAPPPVIVHPELVVTDLRNQIASHSSRIARLLQEREALDAQLEKIRPDEKTSTQLKEQRAKLVRAVDDKNRELREAVSRQEQLLSMAAEHADALEELGNERKLLRFMVGGGVGLRRLEDVQLGPGGGGASPGLVGTEAPRVDVLGAVAFLPVDFNSRDRHQTFSLGVMAGLGGNGFPANVYAGLTLKVWVLYLNAGANFRKEDAWRQGPPTQAAFWQGAWTPTVFAGVALDSEALLALQRVLPPKRAPEGLQVDPR